MTNLQWIAKGNTGCVFATLFAKNPASVNWIFISPREFRLRLFKEDACLISIVFNPDYWNKDLILKWAIENGFFEEKTSDNTTGLRYMCEQGKSWVQYFGKDSHVKTRQSPFPMLMFTRKLNKSHYIKVGFKGLLHLSHAWSDDIKENVYDLLWNQSYKQTKKLLGHTPTIKEAAKTTFIYE